MDETANQRKTLNQVLVAELDCLRRNHGLYPKPAPPGTDITVSQASSKAPTEPASYGNTREEIEDDLKGLFGKIGKWSETRRVAAKVWQETHGRSAVPPQEDAAIPAPLSALCLSGGGIRSATFNLGVLQALARADLLAKFDYLSSVSGGGYIASWLRAWMHRDGVHDVANQLKCGTCFPPLEPEPPPVATLRDYSNYLTPVVGLFSGDTWSAAATILRNLLLNWMVLLPVIGAVVGIPLLFMLFIHTPDWSKPASRILLEVALGIEVIASVAVHSMRRFAKQEGISQAVFIWACVLPICLAAGALSGSALGAHLPGADPTDAGATSWSAVWIFCAVWCIGVPLIGWSIVEGVIRASTTAQRWAAGIKKCSQKQPTKEQLAAHVRSVSFWTELSALAVSGVVGTCLLVGTVKWWFGFLYNRPALYTVFVLPILLGVYLISRVVFVGIASLSDEDPQLEAGARSSTDPARVGSHIHGNDSDREWWSRLSGWILLVIISWTAVTTICLLGCYLPDEVAKLFGFLQATPPGSSQAGLNAHAADTGQSNWVATFVQWGIGALGGVSGLVAALAGNDSKTPANGAAGRGVAPKSTTRLLAIAGPLFVICLIMTLSWWVKAISESIISATPLIKLYTPPAPANLFDFKTAGQQDLPWPITLAFMVILVSLAIIGLVASRFVNVNRFSLHGMYRNRLIRAYLGASNCDSEGQPARIPDPFTGFALTDNFPLHKLCEPHANSVAGNSSAAARSRAATSSAPDANSPPAASQPADPPRKACAPLSIINTTLNLVNGEKLAWQQRKAASFAMTPLFCGSWMTGYRSSATYGGPGGITVGTAITISGAAANPNMGYCSSPVLGFLMAMFNLRLGAWLGNTNEHGDKTYNHPGPRQALLSLLAEMFGLTNARSPYVNLSDGGHFDNLGLYEAVLRRCRYVLVSDAGRDKDFTFEDLGNAIRKIRIDFGINVEFDTIRILGNESTEHGLYCALGHIRYSNVDGTCREDDGLLVYIKPTLRGAAQIPYDIYSYSKCFGEFPHESTVDQWFSECQFESYRALGSHIGTQLMSQVEGRVKRLWPGTDIASLSAAAVLENLHAAVCEAAAKCGSADKVVVGEVPQGVTPLNVTLRPKVVFAQAGERRQ